VISVIYFHRLNLKKISLSITEGVLEQGAEEDIWTEEG
jgi:hypothetical protein